MGLSGGSEIKFPEPADTSGMESLLASNAEMAHAMAGEQLAFAKQQWAEQKAMQREVLDVQLPMMRNQAKWAVEDRERWETEFKPLEDELIADAKDWASDERMELEAGKAQSDVTKAFESQRQNSLRKLEGFGIDPSQTRYQALDRQVRSQAAAVQAAAGNNARRFVEEKGLNLKMAVAGMGRGLPMQAVQTGQSASNIGSQAIANQNAALNTQNNLRGTAGSFLGQSTAAGQAAGNMINAGYQNQLAGWQAQTDNANQQQSNMWSGLGTAAGMAMMMADGGDVTAVATEEGRISGPGGPKADAIPAALSDGEYVVPAEVVKYKGTEHFDKLINKTREHLGIPPEELQMQAGIPVPGDPNAGESNVA